MKNITFKNASYEFTVEEVNCGDYKFEKDCPYVRGSYTGEYRKMPTKLYKDKKTGRPCLLLCHKKLFAENIEDDALIPAEFLNKAPMK